MALDDNAALNSILQKVTRIDKAVRNGYTSLVGGPFVVSNADPYTRPANVYCTRAVVTNLSTTPVRIYENTILVKAALALNETWVSPTSGAGALKIDTAGAASNISLASYILS